LTERPLFEEARASFHAALMRDVLSEDKDGVPSNADKHNVLSVRLAKAILEQLGKKTKAARLAGQMAGHRFEVICEGFLRETFLRLAHLRPGHWTVKRIAGRDSLAIAEFEQYAHLIFLANATKGNPQLRAALGSDYTIAPDIVVVRDLECDKDINAPANLISKATTNLASLRKENHGSPLLHASVSCKWTIRSDRAQNSRSEALILVRNRKGRLPHIVVVTGEPLPSRIASIALGTGDLDCVYHFALYELQAALEQLDHPDAKEMLAIMVEGKRLRDISDLPLDLAV